MKRAFHAFAVVGKAAVEAAVAFQRKRRHVEGNRHADVAAVLPRSLRSGLPVFHAPQHGDPSALGFCPNVSFAFHKRAPHDEYYVIYGSAGNVITVPRFLVKWIHYIGAEKGT